MKFIYLMIAVFMGGCSGAQITRDINKVQIAMAGNKPPTSFKVANLQTMKDYVFDMNGYTVAMPGAKQKDFTLSYGWTGATYYGKNIGLNLYNDKGYAMYGISITTSKVFEYGARERAIELNNIDYIRSIYHKYNPNTNISIQKQGKENYFSVMIERRNNGNKKVISYNSYKFNTQRTKAKSVVAVVTYHKPKNPTLAKQYTYADLKRRAKRMLDSLYIKDGW